MFLALLATLGLLLIAYVYGTAPNALRVAFVGLALVIGIGSYIDHSIKAAAEEARLAAIEAERLRVEEEEKARKKEEAERQAKLKREEEERRRRQSELERNETQRRQAEIERLLPNSFMLTSTAMRGNAAGYIAISRECMIDNTIDSRMRGVHRSVEKPRKRVLYRNTNRYGNKNLQVLFFNALDGNCQTSLQRLAERGYLPGTIFTDNRSWKHAVRVLAPGETPATQSQQVENVIQDGVNTLIKEGLKKIFENR